MSGCPNYLPTEQLQLTYKWGGRYGGANCTPCSAGEVGQAHTCGALLFTGAQIRAASNESVPDPKSPGLNLGQVDAALYKLSGGKIDLDSHYRYSWDGVHTRVVGGAFAILQGKRSVLIALGFGFGNLFGGGHAITTFYRNGWWMDDPLTGRHKVTEAALKAFAAQLVLNDQGDICGFGRAYVAFSRDIVPAYRVNFEPGTTFIYTLRDGMIWDRDGRRFTDTTSAPCRPIRRYLVNPKGPLYDRDPRSRRLAVITAGFLKDKAVGEPNAASHFTITEV